MATIDINSEHRSLEHIGTDVRVMRAGTFQEQGWYRYWYGKLRMATIDINSQHQYKDQYYRYRYDAPVTLELARYLIRRINTKSTAHIDIDTYL